MVAAKSRMTGIGRAEKQQIPRGYRRFGMTTQDKLESSRIAVSFRD